MKKVIFKRTKSEAKEKAPAQKGSFPDFMKKEIYTQSELLQDVISRYIKADRIDFDFLKLNIDKVKRIYITADSAFFGCAVSASHNFEVLTDLVCVPVLLSEFNCANPVLDKNTLVIILGENEKSNDVIIAKKRCEKALSKAIIIVDSADNQDKSGKIINLDWESMSLFPIATYTAKYLVLCLMSLYFGEKAKVVTELYINIATKMLLSFCDKVKNVNEEDCFINSLVQQMQGKDIILTGRNVDYSCALYGQTSLNALCKVRATAVPAGELRYYQNENALLIAFISNRELMQLTLKDIQAYSQNAIIIAPYAISQGFENFENIISYTDSIPLLSPMISTIALQLFIYNIAKSKDLPTDKEQ